MAMFSMALCRWRCSLCNSNLGRLEDVPRADLATAPIIYVDGKHDNWQSAPAITSYL